MDAKIDMVDTKIDDVEAGLSARIDSAADVSEIKMSLENETDKNIQLIAEYHQPMAAKIDSLSDDTDVVKFDVDIIKKAVIPHSGELNKPGKAK